MGLSRDGNGCCIIELMKASEKPLISIIIPIYNVEDCVEKCVDSILAQSYKNIEVILVDDGSKDKSGDICDKYQKKDKRVKVIHKENGGLSSARNAGLDVIRGKYVNFVDGDDALRANCIEDLYGDLIRDDADFSACGFKRFDEAGETTESEADYRGVATSNEAMALLLQDKMYTSACCKLYKKKIFEKLRYDEKNRYGEDLEMMSRILKKDLKISINQKNRAYLYRTRANSIMGKGVYRKTCRDLFEVCDKIIGAEKDGNNRKLAYEFYVSRVLGFCMDCIKYNHKDKEELEFLRRRLLKYKNEQSLYSGRTRQEKINIFLFIHKNYRLLNLLSGIKSIFKAAIK